VSFVVPPLDDPRWLLMVDVFTRLCPHLGNRGVAEHDVHMALAENRLHCLQRYYRRPQGDWPRQIVSFLCWAGYQLRCWGNGKISVISRHDRPWAENASDPRLSMHLRLQGQGFMQLGFDNSIFTGRQIFYAWLPDLERIWPTVFLPSRPSAALSAEQPQSSDEPSRRRKREPTAVRLARELMVITFPDGQWQDMDPAGVRHRCGQDLQVKARLKGIEKPLPSRDSFARAMGRRGERR
jgi:hypothetical protein